MNKLFMSASTVVLVMAATAAAAQTTPDDVGEVIVTGTRQVGIKAADSAAPIQVVGGAQLLQTGAPDLATALSTSVPSLSVQANGADAAAVHVQYSLRGLSPNDTLTLVNGLRRHTTSNLAVDGGSIFSGSAGVDINYIPVAAIDHVEVLTDGAAAQYGTDAIAGVVNIILKTTASGGIMTGEAGENYNDQGVTQRLSYNQGFNLNDKGFINITLEEYTHDHTYVGCGDVRLQNANCQLLPVGGGTYASAANLAGVIHGPNYPSENQINGDPQQAIYNSFINAAYHLTPDIELYAFGNYSYNASEHYENYRVPSKVGACLGGIGAYSSATGVCTGGTAVLAVPNGFSPSEKFDETDYSLTAGARGSKFGWNWNLSTTYGDNKTQVYVDNTDNASEFGTLQGASTTPVSYPTHTIYDGAFDATEWTGQLDVDRSFAVSGLAGPLNVGAGVEGRRDSYGITPGEPESYYGGGAQSFAGYSPADNVSASRTNVAAYLDLATKPIQNLSVDIAGRYEHYSDFGDTEAGKFTARYDFSPQIAIRGTISNGFRAPTLAEGFYTGLNVGPTSVSGQLAPNSGAAQSAGFSPLKPEQSVNYSGGFVLHLIPRLQVTVDAYYILLHDRILPGSGFQALAPFCVPNALVGSIPNNGAAVAKTCAAGQTAEDVLVAPSVLTLLKNQGVTTAGLTNVGVSAFANAVNTRTDGVDITATYSSDFAEYGAVDWSLGFNYNHTMIAANLALPPALYNSTPALGINQTQLLVPTVASALTTAPPREKLILQGYWHKGPWNVTLRETVYNDMSEILTTSPFTDEKIGTAGITDVEIGYKLTRNVKLNVGADNLFDQRPSRNPLSATGQPLSGNVYNSVYSFAPWGQNGGYYYGRVILTF